MPYASITAIEITLSVKLSHIKQSDTSVVPIIKISPPIVGVPFFVSCSLT